MRLKFKWIFTLLLALSMQFISAQEKTVSGVVSDNSGMPVPGVNVSVKGTKSTIQSNFDGKYSIKAKAGDVLVFSFIGMQDATAKVGASNSVNVAMKTATNELGEVVVLGYNQSKRKNEITGNAVQISAEVIKGAPMVSIDQALQGKVAGLQISATSGTPGSVQQIRIRGVNSYSASNEPLYVIDGIPVITGNFSGSANTSSISVLSSIAADNVESMTVLKDAATTSVYGARGANGVILITTKKGTKGATKYNFSSTVGFQNNSSKGLRSLTGAEKKTLLEDGVFNTYGTAYSFTRDKAYDFIVANNLSAPLVAWVGKGSPINDWPKELTNKDALTNNLSFSAQGGDDKQTFYASIGYNKTEGTAIGANFRRVAAVLNYSTKLSDKFRFSNNLSVSNVNQNGTLEQSAYFSNPNLSRYFMSPWISPYNADGTLNTTMAGTSLHNTIFTVAKNIINNDINRLQNSTSLTYNIAKNLRFVSNLGLDYTLTSYKYYVNRINGDAVAKKGYSEASSDRNFNYVAQNSLDYSFKVAENHNFSVKGLFEFQKNKENYLYAYGENFANDVFTNINGASANWNASSTYLDNINLSYLGILNYNFSNKYLVDLNARREASSKFTDAFRWGNFYSIGLGWNINKESFLSKYDFIDELRLRGSYGTNGNSGIGINLYQALLGSTGYNSEPGYIPSQYGSTAAWEKQTKLDVGLEYGFFDNKLRGSVTYYQSKTADMLFSVPLSLTTGHSSATTNAGSMENSGLELELGVDLVRGKNFNWSVNGNFATIKNEVTSMFLVAGKMSNIITGTRIVETGHTLNEWYMRKWAGVDPANGKPLWFVDGASGATTSVYSDAKVNYQGSSAIPKYSGGISTHFDLYNFFVDAGFSFAGGHKVFQDWSTYIANSGNNSILTYNGTEILLDRWQKPGDITDVPKMQYSGTADSNASTSTRWLYDGDFVRLRDLTFGYNFQSDVISKLKMDALSFSVRGTNIVTWVKDSRLKFDPEIQASGFTSLTTPPVKSVVFSINVKF